MDISFLEFHAVSIARTLIVLRHLNHPTSEFLAVGIDSSHRQGRLRDLKTPIVAGRYNSGMVLN